MKIENMEGYEAFILNGKCYVMSEKLIEIVANATPEQTIFIEGALDAFLYQIRKEKDERTADI